MNILLKPFYGDVFKKNAIFQIDNGDNVWFGFQEKLKEMDISINTLDLGSQNLVDSIVFCEVPFFWEIGFWKVLLFNKTKSVLFCFESPLVNPFSHRKFFHKFFKSVYTWNDKLVDNKKVKKLFLPALDTNLDRKEIPLSKKGFICIINSNKAIPSPFSWASPFKKDLYPKRVELIDYFESVTPQQFDLYGRGWNAPKKFSVIEKVFGPKFYKSYKGPIKRSLGAKLDVLSRYKFNLCFENCIAEGYISEKIIDCFKARTVPIYYGAPNIDKYIPKNCFIDYRDFTDNQSLFDFLKGMADKEYKRYLRNSGTLLKDKKFRDQWFEGGFERTFLGAVCSKN